MKFVSCLFVILAGVGAAAMLAPRGDAQAVAEFKTQLAQIERDRQTLEDRLDRTARERDAALTVQKHSTEQIGGLCDQLRQLAGDLARARAGEQDTTAALAEAREQLTRLSEKVQELAAKDVPLPPSTAPRLPSAADFPVLLFRYSRFAKSLEPALAHIRTCHQPGAGNRQQAMTAVRALLFQVQQWRADFDPTEVHYAEMYLAGVLQTLASAE